MAITVQHSKHVPLARPAQGRFGRNEIAILGTTCSNINSLAGAVAAALPQFKIGYADEDHAAGQEILPPSPSIAFTKKASGGQASFNAGFNDLQQRALFTNADLVLVNGNHFTAARQIVVIDEAKPLQKKLDRLTNVQLVLLQEGITAVPGYINVQVPVLSLANTSAIADFIKTWIQQSAPPLHGLVLAGGQSLRMGRDKGSLAYNNGVTQRRHVFNALQPFCGEVYVSCNTTQTETVKEEGLPLIEDSFTGLGPIGGILSAFRHNPDAAWLTVACDLPYLTAATIQQLVEQRDISKVATAFSNTEDNGWPEPLLTTWEPRAYPWLLQLLAQGYSCPRKALINADVALLAIADANELHNVNEYNDYLTTLHNLQAT